MIATYLIKEEIGAVNWHAGDTFTLDISKYTGRVFMRYYKNSKRLIQPFGIDINDPRIERIA